MYFAVFVIMLFLNCSLGTMLVIYASENKPAADVSPGSADIHSERCNGVSLQAIRKALLGELNLQQEPQVVAGRVTAIRKQWRTAFNAISHNTLVKAVASAQTENGPGAETSAGLRCCQLAKQISLEDLGWENWVIYPERFTYIHCSLCNSQLGPTRCACHNPNGQDSPSQPQKPCCQATSHEYIPFLYIDRFSALTISPVQLTRTCGPDNPQLPAQD